MALADRSLLWSESGPVVILVIMETIPITEAKARSAELADRVAREHDHLTITRNGRADVMLISVAEYESMQETLDILSDEETLADLRQSREDFADGETFDVTQVRMELERRRRGTR
jgi:antitoxin YefM